jgi:hypothetical protein
MSEAGATARPVLIELRAVCIIDLSSVVAVEKAGLATGFFVSEIWNWMNQQLFRITADMLIEER